MPLFSVILPTFNRWPLLNRAIESVLNQEFQDYELIIVDDGSSDNTKAEIFERYGSELASGRMVWLEHSQNQGVSASRNTGIQLAKGEWLAFIDSDDEWLPEKLKCQEALIQSYPRLHWHHCEEIWLRSGVRVNPKKEYQKIGGDIFVPSTKLCLVGPSCVILRKSIVQDLGGFREDFPVCEDYDLWLRLAIRNEIGFTAKALVKKYGGHEDQLSRKFHSMDYWRVKSLISILRSGELSQVQDQCVRDTLVTKAEILLRGYQKHKNMENFNEVSDYLIEAKSKS